MTNKDIAIAFQRLARIMELLGENPFKIRSYQNAYVLLRKWPDDLSALSLSELEAIEGIGKAIAAKIRELVETGDMATYRKYTEQVPSGVIEMLDIPGIGPKKVGVIWKELGVEGAGELLYACQENRLVGLRGFGVKSQQEILEKLEFHLSSMDRWTGIAARRIAAEVGAHLEALLAGSTVVPTGELRRWCPIVDRIELLWVVSDIGNLPGSELLHRIGTEELRYQDGEGPSVTIHLSTESAAGRRLWETTGSTAYVAHYRGNILQDEDPDESAWLERQGLPLHTPEWREDPIRAESFAQRGEPLLDLCHLKGVVHAHSTWSDGVNTLEQMALACMQAGYQYLVITDHSQAAFYAQGLEPERVLAQHREIDALNARLHPFRIFKGIEADILHDGSLDYTPEVLETFEVVIASIHSNLRMTEEKAMSRLIAAIEHRRTHILGHPTGRILLGRAGYPVDHRRLIDACSGNGVSIELNANPLRLDLDWGWLPYAMEKGVPISINPDAHSVKGLEDIHCGLHTARKGGLTPSKCLNALDLEAFASWAGTR